MFRNSTPFTRLVLILFIILVSSIVFMIAGSLGAMLFMHVNIYSGAGVDAIEKMTDINLMKYYQIVESTGMFIVPPLIMAHLTGNTIPDFLKMRKAPGYQTVLLLLLVIIVSSPLINFMTEINSCLKLPGFLSGIENWMKETEDKAGQITEKFLTIKSAGGFTVNLLMIGLIPALGEEFLFRGVLQGIFTDWTKNKHWGIVISALLFSAFHLQFYGFLPRFMLGVFFGYLFVWSNNIWVPVSAHFINNSLSVITWFAAGKELNDKIDTQGTDLRSLPDILLVLLSAVMVTGLIFAIFRKEKRIL